MTADIRFREINTGFALSRKQPSFFSPYRFFNPLNVPSAQCLDLAAEFEVSANFGIIEDPETIDDRQRCAGP
ncbi:MAG TPA: hypothetical protein PLQ45_05865, partial [Anaerohalosphaeraceae bacterium]|nr:hypothetical protein [Anaerohalosphaeraceae bacterium]